MMAGPLSAGEHRIVMMIDNGRFEAVGDAIVRDSAMMKAVAHSNTDHTQTNWNGVVGYLRVEAARASIARLDVRAPDRHVTVRIELDAFDADNRFPSFWSDPHDDQLVLEFALEGVAEPVVIRKPIAVSSGFTPVTVDADLPAEAVINRLEFDARLPNTITNAQSLREHLVLVREQGYACDNEEIEENVICFGAPIFNWHGQVIAAISVSMPIFRFDEANRETLLRELKSAAQGISSTFGFQGHKAENA